MNMPVQTLPRETQKQAAKRRTGEMAIYSSLDLVVLIAVIAAVLGIFQKTVFGGQPISRIYQLAQRDSLFSQFFAPAREAYDASVYQYFVPNHVWTSKTLASGQLPLWNPLTGCGAPHVADIETAVFWPLRLALVQFDPIWSWNLLIALNLVLMAVCTYIFSRALGAGRIAGGISAITVAACPYLVFQSELIGGCSAFIPLTMACFVKAADSNSIFWKIAAGAVCGIMIISGHPEPTFFGILFSCILYTCIAWYRKPKDARAIGVLKDIATAGAFAFCLCAFAFLPFVELLANSDCYKLGVKGWDFSIPLNAIFINLIHPAYGSCSPFLGIVVPVMALVAAISCWRYSATVRGIVITLGLAFVLMAQIPPINFLAHMPGFSWFVPKYCFPSIMVLLAGLSAVGLDQIITRHDDRSVRKATLAAIAAIGVILAATFAFPVLLKAAPIDETMVQMAIKDKVLIKDAIILAALMVLIPLLMRLPKGRAAALGLVAAIATGASLLPITKQASPPSPKFQYATTPPLTFLAGRDERIVTMGRHVFCPDTNLAYGMSNLVPVNVYHPKRFQQFMTEAGITHEGVNQFFDGRLTKFVNLASVKYVVSPNPVLSKDEQKFRTPRLDSKDQALWDTEDGAIVLKGAVLRYYPHNSEVIGRAKIEVPATSAKRFGVQVVLLDEDEKVVWFSDVDRLEYMFAKTTTGTEKVLIDKDVCAAIPYGTQPGTMLTAAIQIFDFEKGQQVEVAPKRLNDKAHTSAFPLATFTREGHLLGGCAPFVTGQPDERPFRLVLETLGKARIYENTEALPPAYIVHSVVPVETANEALDALNGAGFNPLDSAIVECSQPPFKPVPPSMLEELRSMDQVVVSRPDPNTVKLKCKVSREGMLVLTDTFYPGWKAYMCTIGNCEEIPIYRANYLFRAVPVKPGDYTIEFRYWPLSMFLGFALSAVALMAVAALAVLHVQGLTLEDVGIRNPFKKHR